MITLTDPVSLTVTVPPKPDYQVVYADCSNALEKQVSALLATGWTPIGGVQVTLDRHTDCQGMVVVEWNFHQAMIK